MKEEFAPGHLLIRLRRGEQLELDLQNQYLFQAQRMTDILYTKVELKEKFPGIFNQPSHPLLLEIGCYMGMTVEEIARLNPDLNVLGVDIKYKRVVKSCRRIRRAGLDNAKIAIADARELIHLLPDESLSGIIAFFPDPWRKNRHEKNRFLSDSFFEITYSKLSRGGFTWIKTDNRDYYLEAKDYARKNGFTIIDTLPRPLISENHTTFFEQLFLGNGQSIDQLILLKQ